MNQRDDGSRPGTSAVSRSETLRAQGGSTLLELMIGTVIVVIVLGAIVSLCLQQSDVRQLERERSLALVACRNNLEELRSVPFSQLPVVNGSGFDVPGSNGSPGGLEPVDGDADGLPGEFLVAVDKTSSGETLYRVKATVRWKGNLGPLQLSLETLMAERKAE